MSGFPDLDVLVGLINAFIIWSKLSRLETNCIDVSLVALGCNFEQQTMIS